MGNKLVNSKNDLGEIKGMNHMKAIKQKIENILLSDDVVVPTFLALTGAGFIYLFEVCSQLPK